MERWLPIEGFPWYEVSDLGRCRSSHKGVLKGTIRGGYRAFHLTREDGHHKKMFAHVLVLTAFVGPRPPGAQTRHFNGRHLDNWLGNLKWGTHLENAADSARLGRFHRGERIQHSKLNPSKVREIRALVGPFDAAQRTALEARFGVKIQNIYKIRDRSAWAHVT